VSDRLLAAAVVLGAAIHAGAAEPAAEVETRPAAPHGTTAMSVCGRVQPHGRPAACWFEYGETTAYGARTPERPLPPRLAAYYRETWDDGPAGWTGGMSGKDLAHHATGGASGGFMRFSEPSGDDPNHVDGIGTLHLSSYFYPGTHPNPAGMRALWAAGAPDLRDARVRIAVRGNGWKANGSELVWWTQSENDPKLQGSPNWRRANWAYTGFRLTDALRSGKWERVDYRLTNDPHAWTYGGNNLAQKRPNYAYAPIDQSLGRLDCDFFHLLAFIDPAKRPTGTIDFDDFEVSYRNYSLLLPSNGGRLERSPAGAANDPAALTDGWRHGPGRAWRSAASPTGPLEFEYAFERPVTLRAVQLHQHPEWPAKDVEVLASADGKAWSPLLKQTLPAAAPGGPNFNYALTAGLKVPASRLKVRLLSGHKPQHWGLGEIEAFGDGAAMATDDDWYHVNADVTGLTPGRQYHYRLVVKTASGTAAGPDAAFTVPDGSRPHVVTGPASRLTATAATVEGRLAPLGQRAEYAFEYGPTSAYGHKTNARYAGLQPTPRWVAAELTGLTPGTTYHYRLLGVGASGTAAGEDRTFTTPVR
jgi:hypothetical protein